MSGIKGNRRTLYTKMIIKESLLKLLQYKDIHEITVTDICKSADINRGTFYSHYKDAYDLLQSMENELFSTVEKYIKETPMKEYYNTLLLRVLNLIAENKDLCKILLGNHGDSSFIEKVVVLANKADIEKVYETSNEFDKSYLDYYTKYVVGGCVAIIRTWLDNNMPQSPEELVHIINSVSVVSSNFIESLKK